VFALLLELHGGGGARAAPERGEHAERA